ncbi:hypothetical protein ACFRKB_32080 [Streptomyces scopuliridis]|uniref:hypothetical protein n=1 Tax=Streptomyces scopuliridis TaxID=452529 RepID=UPI0036988974
MPSADEILRKMKAVQKSREEAIVPLMDILVERSSLLDQLAALDEPYSKAYVVAEGGGWSTEELQKLGADEPVKRPRVRSKRSRSSAKKTGGHSSGAAPEGGSPAGIPAQDGAAAADSAALSSASD